VTVVCTCADSYVEVLAREAGAAVDLAAARNWQSILTCLSGRNGDAKSV